MSAGPRSRSAPGIGEKPSISGLGVTPPLNRGDQPRNFPAGVETDTNQNLKGKEQTACQECAMVAVLGANAFCEKLVRRDFTVWVKVFSAFV